MQGIATWAPEELLDFLLNGVHQEVCIVWEDQWSPTELLQDVGLQGLLGANSVEAVGCVKEHGPDVYLVRYSGGVENINLQSVFCRKHAIFLWQFFLSGDSS